MNPLALCLLFAMTTAAPARAEPLKPGTAEPMSQDFSADPDQGLSRDPVDTLHLIKDALLKYGGTGLPAYLDLNYNEQWAGVGYDSCDEGVTEGGAPAAAQICDGQNVIAAGTNLLTMTGDCERVEKDNCVGGPKPRQVDGVAFVLAHEMAHLAARDPQEIRKTIARECERWGDSPDAADWRQQVFFPMKLQLAPGGSLSPDAKSKLYLQLIKDCVRLDTAKIMALKQAMEDRADANGLQILNSYNQNASASGGKAPFASFNLYAGGCAMRKLRDLEWVYADPGQQASGDKDHADALARAKRLDAIAKNVFHAP
jgi:hypothetical protein